MNLLQKDLTSVTLLSNTRISKPTVRDVRLTTAQSCKTQANPIAIASNVNANKQRKLPEERPLWKPRLNLSSMLRRVRKGTTKKPIRLIMLQKMRLNRMLIPSKLHNLLKK